MFNKKINPRRKNKMEYVYAALLLHKAGKEVNEEGLKKVLEAAGIAVDESKMKTLMASLKDVDIDKELENAVVAAAPAAGAAEAEKPAEKKKEEKKEEAAEGLSSLFG
jgi:large subunit ribosomal protein L12